jgi:isoleucyl-tRNA synthetase
LPVKAKAAGKKQAKGSTAEAVQGGLDTESYELLEKIPGSSLVGKK